MIVLSASNWGALYANIWLAVNYSYKDFYDLIGASKEGSKCSYEVFFINSLN